MNSYFALNAWTVTDILKNGTTSVKGWVNLAGVLLGAIAFGFAIWFLISSVWNKQERGKKIMEGIFALVIAALLGGNGMRGLDSIQKGMSDTVTTNVGGGTGTGNGATH